MPNHTCCVPGCTNRQTTPYHSTLRFYKFPKETSLRGLWLQKVSREPNFVVTANTRVCSEHFEGGCKDENHPAPTIFPWKRPAEKRKCREHPPVRAAARMLLLQNQAADEVIAQTAQATVAPATSAQTAQATVTQETALTAQATAAQETALTAAQETALTAQATATSVSPTLPPSPATSDIDLVVADKGTQCENDRAFVHALLTRIKLLESECVSLRSELTTHRFSMDRIAECDHDVAYYTGFSSYQLLMTLWNYLGEKVNHLRLWRGQETNLSGAQLESSRRLKPIDEFLLCLMRLRLGLQIKIWHSALTSHQHQLLGYLLLGSIFSTLSSR